METYVSDVLDLKKTIREDVVSRFVIDNSLGQFVAKDKFFRYLEKIGDNRYDLYKVIMASLIADCYELLKWKLICKQLTIEEEDKLLDDLEEAKNFDEALETIKRNGKTFLWVIYQYSLQKIPETINTKNNLYANEPNMNILKEDKLCLFTEIYLRNNNLLFSKEYNEADYIKLYDYFKREGLNDTRILSYYSKIIRGLSFYNPKNFNNLLFDMCKEFYFQLEAMRVGPCTLDECTLLDFINIFPNEYIIEMVPRAQELYAILISFYMDYRRYDNNARCTVEQSDEHKKVFHKLDEGKI